MQDLSDIDIKEKWETMRGPWVKRKRGMFYRQNNHGYTPNIGEAGFYTKEEAQADERACPGEITAVPLAVYREMAERAVEEAKANLAKIDAAILNHGIGDSADLTLPITDDWLKSAGFKWKQLNRQPDKHWLLWLGDAVRENNGDGHNLTSYEDIGIEVAPGATHNEWFCWLRSDAGSMYGRFIHVRHMSTRLQLVRLIEAITNQPWTPEYHSGGSCRGKRGFEAMQRYALRDDVQMMFHRIDLHCAWHDMERDPHRAGADAADIRELINRQQGNDPSK